MARKAVFQASHNIRNEDQGVIHKQGHENDLGAGERLSIKSTGCYCRGLGPSTHVVANSYL